MMTAKSSQKQSKGKSRGGRAGVARPVHRADETSERNTRVGRHQPEREVVGSNPTRRIPVRKWHGCYDQSWKDIICPAAFQHPAKFARGLIQRILDHGIERRYWQRGDIIGDPFGGVGLGGIEAAYRGLRWFGVEIEQRFVWLANQNFKDHARKWNYLGCPHPTIFLGDSRFFDQAVDAVVGSPPYSESNQDYDKGRESIDFTKGTRAGWKTDKCSRGSYDVVVTSPPFLATSGGAKGIAVDGYTGRGKVENVGDRTYGDHHERTTGNIERCKDGSLDSVITSPVYSDISTG